MKYIGYYRVSTKEQGVSGLGLESQREAVNTYVSSVGGEMLGEYTEIESGKKKDRSILLEAIHKAASENAILVVKKLDRLSRGGLHIMVELENLGVRFIESDAPHDNELMREIKLSFARDEARAISNRTKSALGVIKKKVAAGDQHISKSGNVVTGLGKPENLTRKAIDRSIAVRSKKAKDNPDNRKAIALIKPLRDSGQSYYVIRQKLNDAGFKTSRGNSFSEVQVKRLYNQQ